MKKKRLNAILELISKNEISTQEELIELLNVRGFNVTQATVSRDIKELNLVKGKNGRGIYCYINPKSNSDSTAKYESIFVNTVISVDYAMNNVVLKCSTGMAQAACAALDSLNHKYIIGTIAGDDTVLAVVRTEEQAVKLTAEIRGIINK